MAFIGESPKSRIIRSSHEYFQALDSTCRQTAVPERLYQKQTYDCVHLTKSSLAMDIIFFIYSFPNLQVKKKDIVFIASP